MSEHYEAGEQLWFLDVVLESIHDSVVICDREFTITYCNKASERIYGIKPSEAIGKKFFDVAEIPEAWLGEDTELHNSLERKECCRQEQLKRIKHGELWISISIQEIKIDGNRHGWTVVTTDMTEYKRLEYDLQGKTKHLTCLRNLAHIFSSPGITLDTIYRKVVELIPAIWLHPGAVSTRINIGGKEFKTEQFAETMAKNSWDIKVHGAKVGVLEVFYLEDGAQITNGSFFKEGTFVMDDVARRLGRVTERKAADDELDEYRSHLEELVVKRTAELAMVNARFEREIVKGRRIDRELKKLYKQEKGLRTELEVQMKRRIEFTRALVHELRTPLTVLVAASDLLVANKEGQLGETLARNIQLGALSLNRRVSELLDIAKSEVGILQLKYHSVDLFRLLVEVAEYITAETTQKGQHLVLSLPSSLPILWGDEERLRQVVLNLIDNASKFTPENGTITLKARQKDSNILVEVQDTGCGIGRSELIRLFQPYHRLESDRQLLSGLGLGLVLCKTFIELHRGKIWVKSRLGRGCTFSFLLPVEMPQSILR